MIIYELIFDTLKESGIDVYAPDTHKGKCISPYVVLKKVSANQFVKYSTQLAYYDILCYAKNHTECTFKNIVVSNFISNGDSRGWKIPYFVQAHKVDNLLVSNSILYYSEICSDSSANILQNNIILKETDNVN